MNRQGYIPHIKKAIKGQRVLDVGCCATYVRNNLKRHLGYKKAASKIIGIDIHTEFLKLGMQQHQVELYHCDITDKLKVGLLAPVLGQFDHVIATDILEHITNPKALLDNLHLFSTPQARVYMTTPNVRSPWWMKCWIANDNKALNADHVCWYDIDTLRVLLSRSGFKIDELFYCTDPQDKHVAKRFGLTWQPWMGRRMYFVLRKVE